MQDVDRVLDQDMACCGPICMNDGLMIGTGCGMFGIVATFGSGVLSGLTPIASMAVVVGSLLGSSGLGATCFALKEGYIQNGWRYNCQLKADKRTAKIAKNALPQMYKDNLPQMYKDNQLATLEAIKKAYPILSPKHTGKLTEEELIQITSYQKT